MAAKPIAYMPLYRSFQETAEEMETIEEKVQFYESLTNYYFYNKLPDENTLKSVRQCFRMAKPSLDAARQHYKDGCKGGRPPKGDKPSKGDKPAPGSLNGEDISQEELERLNKEMRSWPGYKQ